MSNVTSTEVRGGNGMKYNTDVHIKRQEIQCVKFSEIDVGGYFYYGGDLCRRVIFQGGNTADNYYNVPLCSFSGLADYTMVTPIADLDIKPITYMEHENDE